MASERSLYRKIQELLDMAKSLKDFKLISSASVEFGRRIAQRIVYQYSFNARNFKGLVYMLVSDGRAFSITCTSTPEEFASHEKIFEDICKTFEIAAPPAKADTRDAKRAEPTSSPGSTTIP